ncbi:MAG: PorV/PorQ family protein [candidate division Zixibacteria bacterium]|nr:PorV/PorQ family protein [Candidatus Tariuqbacter arcticus]
MKKQISTLFLILIILSTANAQLFSILGGQRVGTSSAAFLKIAVGARAEGMGGAFVGVADDPSCLYWNPAGAAQLKSDAVLFNHIEWPADIKYEYIGIVHHIGRWGTLGFSAISLHMDDMEETSEYFPSGTGNYFTFGDFAAAISWSLKMTDNFSFGITGRYLQEDLAGLTMRGGMLDLGTYYKTGFRDMTFAVTLANFGPDMRPGGSYMNPVEGGDEIETKYQAFPPPTVFRLGSAISVYRNLTTRWLVSIQLNHPVDNAENIALGSELQTLKFLFIRGGYKVNYDEEVYSFGAGLEIPFKTYTLTVDYAYSDFGLLGDSQRFSLSFWL